MNLIIIAHPDDEAFWFSSILLRSDCEVILVTCGDTKKRKEGRKKEFEKSMKLFGVKKYTILSHKDKPGRLDIKNLEEDLRKFSNKNYDEIYTHGIYGDTYNHPHHQDVCYTVHKVFQNRKVYSTSWNLFPDKVNLLEKEEYILKKYVIGTIYEIEYEKLQDAYEISSIEKFIQLDFEEIDVFYWSCANFGDHHDYLSKYKDFWGFTSSPYEIERHDLIINLIKNIPCKKILEIGACEGVLSKKLSGVYKVSCMEKNPKYKKILKQKGFLVLENPKYSDYDLVIFAQVFEYIKNEEEYLSKIDSNYILIDITPSKKRKRRIKKFLSDKYKLICEDYLSPRWEPMYIGGKKKKLEIYRMGSNAMLFEKK
ncbi:PIG-L family deacetylase [Candidatus Woesearchaeota archaeon]|nr:PIG-L family deacetylase [Candidatus Woesearchaeota archaeon]